MLIVILVLGLIALVGIIVAALKFGWFSSSSLLSNLIVTNLTVLIPTQTMTNADVTASPAPIPTQTITSALVPATPTQELVSSIAEVEPTQIEVAKELARARDLTGFYDDFSSVENLWIRDAE